MFLLVFLSTLTGILARQDSLIIGGNDVKQDGKYPWQGSLRTGEFHNCGISLISDRWGVTAAHCVVHKNRPSLRFMFGSNQRNSMDFIVKAERIIWHEKYNIGPGAFANDIAVVKFDQSVVGENISPIPLAETGSEHSGNSDCWITGFGYMADWEQPEVLQEAHVKVYSPEECDSIWGGLVNDGHVCMGDTENGRTSCSGDSGGPLVCKVNGRYELVGVTSWGPSGPDGCVADPPSVYTRVEHFREWIEEQTGI